MDSAVLLLLLSAVYAAWLATRAAYGVVGYLLRRSLTLLSADGARMDLRCTPSGAPAPWVDQRPIRRRAGDQRPDGPALRLACLACPTGLFLQGSTSPATAWTSPG
jgi:hypothetical protein